MQVGTFTQTEKAKMGLAVNFMQIKADAVVLHKQIQNSAGGAQAEGEVFGVSMQGNVLDGLQCHPVHLVFDLSW